MYPIYLSPWSLLGPSQTTAPMRARQAQTTRKTAEPNEPSPHWQPAVDINEDTNRFLICADLPGVDPKTIELALEEGVLSISGKRQDTSSQDKPSQLRCERVQGVFRRSFRLPETVDFEKVSAHCENGVLEITVPKHIKPTPKRIEVNH